MTRLAIEVCEDCGRESAVPCPYEATTCSGCSATRERSVPGLSNNIPACPAHGAYLTAEDAEEDEDDGDFNIEGQPEFNGAFG